MAELTWDDPRLGLLVQRGVSKVAKKHILDQLPRSSYGEVVAVDATSRTATVRYSRPSGDDDVPGVAWGDRAALVGERVRTLYWQDSGDRYIDEVVSEASAASGKFLIGAPGANAWGNTLQAVLPTDTPLTIKGATNHTADLFQVWSGGASFLRVKPPPANGGFVHIAATSTDKPTSDQHFVGFRAQMVGKGTSSFAEEFRVIGFRANVSDHADVTTIAVTGVANNGAGLIRITTASAHPFATGDHVAVYGVGGVTVANDAWAVTVIDSTHVDLQGSAFSGTYTSGGNITNRPMMNGIAITVGPTQARGGLTGGATNGDDLAGLTIHNVGSARATTAIYIANSSGTVTGNAWSAILDSDADAQFQIHSGIATYDYGIHWKFATFAQAAILLPNDAPIKAMTTGGVEQEVMRFDSNNRLAIAASMGTDWTPGLTFGNGNTGMTFASRNAQWRKIGDTVFCWGYITLSAKGTSTGAAKISDLPFTVNAASRAGAVGSCFYSGMAGLAGLVVRPIENTATAELHTPGAAATAALTEANFTDTSTIRFAFWYRT